MLRVKLDGAAAKRVSCGVEALTRRAPAGGGGGGPEHVELQREGAEAEGTRDGGGSAEEEREGRDERVEVEQEHDEHESGGGQQQGGRGVGSGGACVQQGGGLPGRGSSGGSGDRRSEWGRASRAEAATPANWSGAEEGSAAHLRSQLEAVARIAKGWRGEDVAYALREGLLRRGKGRGRAARTGRGAVRARRVAARCGARGL